MISWQQGSVGINIHPALFLAFYILLVPPVARPSLKPDGSGVCCVTSVCQPWGWELGKEEWRVAQRGQWDCCRPQGTWVLFFISTLKGHVRLGFFAKAACSILPEHITACRGVRSGCRGGWSTVCTSPMNICFPFQGLLSPVQCHHF